MDMRATDEDVIDMTHENDHFLLDEGLEVLANYRSISSEAVRAALRQLISQLADEARSV